jgi:hypothetical protein
VAYRKNDVFREKSSVFYACRNTHFEWVYDNLGLESSQMNYDGRRFYVMYDRMHNENT